MARKPPCNDATAARDSRLRGVQGNVLASIETNLTVPPPRDSLAAGLGVTAMDRTAFAPTARKGTATGPQAALCRLPAGGPDLRHRLIAAARVAMADLMAPVVNMGLEEIQKQAKAS